MSTKYADILDKTLGELGTLRQSLLWAETAALNQNPIQKQSAYIVTASAYVLCAATVEEYSRRTLSLLYEDIVASNTLPKDLRVSLFAVLGDAQFESLKDLRDYEKTWAKRIELLTLISMPKAPSTPGEPFPLDGRTIRPVHLETIWKIFGFKSSPFPSLHCRAALSELADSRNEVAHGHISSSLLAKKKGARDTIIKIQRIEDLLTHITIQATEYITNREFLRPASG